MSDDPNNQQPSDPPAPPPPPGTPPGGSPPAQEEMVPKARVEEIVRDRLARDRQARAKEQPATTAKKEEPPPSGDDTRSRLEFMEALDELDWKPTRDDKELLRATMVSQGREAMDKLASRLKAAAPSTSPAPAPGTPPPAEGPTYRSPGAPSGATQDVFERDATKWDSNTIARLKSDGTFLSKLEEYRQSLPGGSNGLFRKRIPKVS